MAENPHPRIDFSNKGVFNGKKGVKSEGEEMAKTKTPLFSLGSRGTIGKTLTTQKRGAETLVREKPIPAYRRTLPQVYQRWLYEDYAYLWTQQTEATKREYASNGVRHHLTGFQYWMKYNLTNLPDLLAIWHLDHVSGALTPDSSKLNNSLGVIGASPITGLIDQALYFDGLNDFLWRNPTPAYYGHSELTLEYFFIPYLLGSFQYHCDHRSAAAIGFLYTLQRNTNKMGFTLSSGAGGNAMSSNTVNLEAINYAAFLTSLGDNSEILLNDTLTAGAVQLLVTQPSTVILTFGIKSYISTNFYKGVLDHIFLWSRRLPVELARRHSLRRYPI